MVQIAQDSSIAVGTLTGAPLFTSASSALAKGCTIATQGVTVTACGDIPKITGIHHFNTAENVSEMYVKYGDTGSPISTKGDIKIEVVLMNVWDQDVLNSLITTIAATLQGLSVNTTNDIPVFDDVAYCYARQDPDYSNYTSVSSIILAMYSEQATDTNGVVQIQDLQVQLTFEGDEGGYECGIGSFILDALAVLAIIPGFEWLDTASFATIGSFSGSLECLVSGEIGA